MNAPTTDFEAECSRLRGQLAEVLGQRNYLEERLRLNQDVHEASTDLIRLHRDRADRLQAHATYLEGELARANSKLALAGVRTQPIENLNPNAGVTAAFPDGRWSQKRD